MKEITTSNAAFLAACVLSQGLSRQEAATKANIGRATFARLMKRNLPIRVATAFKLQQAFGSDAVKIVGVENFKE